MTEDPTARRPRGGRDRIDPGNVGVALLARAGFTDARRAVTLLAEVEDRVRAAAGAEPFAPDALVADLGATADPDGPLTGLYRVFARAMPHLDPERTARRMNALMRLLGARGEHADALPDGSAYASLPAAWDLVMAEAGPQLLDDVRCPVVLVNGQLDQMRLHVRRFADHARDACVVTIPRATHLLPATHPEQLATILRQALGLARPEGPPTQAG